MSFFFFPRNVHLPYRDVSSTFASIKKTISSACWLYGLRHVQLTDNGAEFGKSGNYRGVFPDIL